MGCLKPIIPVRPSHRYGSVAQKEGLSHEEAVLVTEDGKILPLDEDEHRVEMARMQVGMYEARSKDSGTSAGSATLPVGIGGTMEEDVKGVPVRVRKAPKEPIKEQRRQPEAMHIPYRSWC